MQLARRRRLPDLGDGVDHARELRARCRRTSPANTRSASRCRAALAARSLIMRAWLVASSTMPSTSRPEHHAAHHRRGRVVEVHDHAPGAAHGLEAARDQGLARRRQHLDRDVVRDQVVLDQLADEVELGLRGRGEADLDLLEAHAHQRLEHAQLALASIGSISAWLPSRRSELHHTGALSARVRPGAVGQAHRRDGTVLGGGVLEHGHRCSPGIFFKATPQKETARCVAQSGPLIPELCSDVNDQSTAVLRLPKVIGAMPDLMKMNIAW